jgi:PEP-CTERM motif
MSSRSRLLLAAFLFFQIAAPITLRAEPIPLSGPFTLIADGGLPTIQFAGSNAGFDSVLFLSAPDEQGPFFPNHSTAVGTSSSLGAFAVGTELVFRLHVLTTGDDFFTGPASRNPDGAVHAQARLWAGTPSIPTTGVLVGFEDLFGAGDSDFNDFQFVVGNVRLVDTSPVPEPATLRLFATGAAAIGRRAWKVHARQHFVL